MERMHRSKYDTLREGAEVLERDQHGEKVLRLVDGTFLKLFRRKSWLSKSTLTPPAQRFARNCLELERRGIPCPSVISLFKLGRPYRSGVHYRPLPGQTLRDILRSQEGHWSHDQLEQLAIFVHELHQLGVYFRSLHLGNIVLTPQSQYGLIDVSDMKLQSVPLSDALRRRNMKHLFRYHEEWPAEAQKTFLEHLSTCR